jgi:aspartate aminotransferase-like enzyme
MYLTIEAFGQTLERSPVLRSSFTDSAPPDHQVFNFLPGPVTPAPEVRAVFNGTAVSHRGQIFLTRMAEVRSALCRLTNAADVQVVLGSGSLSNEVVAAQLSLLDTTGMVLSNGEFGERLAGNAKRARLRFDWMRLPWGQLFDINQVLRFAERLPRGGWIWFVHHETSTGVMNPLSDLKALASQLGLHLCCDCISSVGALPVDLHGVYLATTASGKGLGSYPGLSMIFHDYQPKPEADRLPGYLDLGHWSTHQSVPHTHSSNLVFALAEAVRRATPERMTQIADNAAWFRRELRTQGFALVAPEAVASPGIVTIALDEGMSAAELGEELEIRGYWLNYRSSYLMEKNWIQVSLLGNPERANLEKLLHVLHTVCTRYSHQKNGSRDAAKR